jgi:hypothetical protein
MNNNEMGFGYWVHARKGRRLLHPALRATRVANDAGRVHPDRAIAASIQPASASSMSLRICASVRPVRAGT